MPDPTALEVSSSTVSAPSSSSSGNLPGSNQPGAVAPDAASPTGPQPSSTPQSQEQRTRTPERPSYVLDSEWDVATGKIREDLFGKRVSDLAAFKAEQDIRRNSLPTAPDKYEIKLPPDFQAPQGVQFQFDQNSPELKRAREIAHTRGVDQETFSDMLGVFAATKIAEQQNLAVARNAELAKLGSAAPQRIGAIETWLKARVGQKADLIIAQMRNYPVASMVEAFEDIVRLFSHQGGADYSQSGRAQPDNNGKIEGYDTMTFEQRRLAQDMRAGRVIAPSGHMAANPR